MISFPIPWKRPTAVARRLTLTAALVVAGCATPAGEPTAPTRGGAGSTASAAAAGVRVLVYNIHAGRDAAGAENLERVAALVRSSGADLVLLQEVDRGTRRSGGVDQLAQLEQRTGFHGAFGRTLDYQGGGYGIAVLSRWPISGDTLHPLAVEPAQERAGGSYEPRGALGVRVAPAVGGFGVVNTHLDASGDDRYRRQEVVGVLAAAERLRGGTPWVVVGGDFNAEPDTRVVERMRAGGWTDAWRECGDGDGLTFSTDVPVKRIDYLFLAPGLTCASAEVLESAASDHRPLLVVVTGPAVRAP